MLAQALEANGATVVILGRREEVLEQAAGTAVRGR
jgi:NADP-dependent 3-hydroxy acid dehydrogenase YdfG